MDKNILNELGLKFLPKDWHKLIDLPNTKWLENGTHKSKWAVTHVSAESFFENKHGTLVLYNFI